MSARDADRYVVNRGNVVGHADYAARLAKTRQRIEEAGLDGLLVVSQYNRRLSDWLHADGP